MQAAIYKGVVHVHTVVAVGEQMYALNMKVYSERSYTCTSTCTVLNKSGSLTPNSIYSKGTCYIHVHGIEVHPMDIYVHCRWDYTLRPQLYTYTCIREGKRAYVYYYTY